MRTENFIEDLKNLEDMFSNLDENHEIFSNKNKKLIGKFEIETPENVWTNELVCLRSKMYASESGNESKNQTNGISESCSKILDLRNIKIF